MDSAIFGFIGVIAGSLTTGSLQYATEWRARRNDSLIAARIVYGALVDVELAVTGAVKQGSLASGTRFTQEIGMWQEQRVALARRLGVYDFNIVQAAFSHVRNYDDVLHLAGENGDVDHGVGRIDGDPYCQQRIDTLNEAQQIALDVSSRWPDRRRRDEDIKRLVNRP